MGTFAIDSVKLESFETRKAILLPQSGRLLLTLKVISGIIEALLAKTYVLIGDLDSPAIFTERG